MRGFAKLDKELHESPVWRDPDAWRLYTYLLLNMAAGDTTFTDAKTKETTNISKYQLVVGRKQLARDILGTDSNRESSMIYRRLQALEKQGLVSLETTKKFTVVTVLGQDKWAKKEPEVVQEPVSVVPPIEEYEPPPEVEELDQVLAPIREVKQDSIAYYQEVIGMANPIVMEKLMHWEKDLNVELVKEAIKRMAEANVNNIKYLEKILIEWSSKNVTSLEQVTALDNQHKRQKQQKYAKPTRKEVIPEVMKNRTQTQPVAPMDDFEERKRKLAERLANRKNGTG